MLVIEKELQNYSQLHVVLKFISSINYFRPLMESIHTYINFVMHSTSLSVRIESKIHTFVIENELQ